MHHNQITLSYTRCNQAAEDVVVKQPTQISEADALRNRVSALSTQHGKAVGEAVSAAGDAIGAAAIAAESYATGFFRGFVSAIKR